MTKQELLDNAKTLPKDEQIDLVMDLWDQIELQANDLPPTEEQKRELDCRLAAYEANPDNTLDWEDVRNEILKDL